MDQPHAGGGEAGQEHTSFCICFEGADRDGEGSAYALQARRGGLLQRIEVPNVQMRRGDTVGLGIDFRSNSCFFTLAGCVVPAPKQLLCASLTKSWRPLVGVCGGATLGVNLGGRPFSFDVAGMERGWWAEW